MRFTRLLPLLILLCKPPLYAQDISSPSAVPKNLQFQGTSYTSYDNGIRAWEIHAASVHGSKERLKGLHIRGTLYEKEKPRYYLKSPMAYFNTATNNILFPLGVTLTGPKGEIVEVGVLLWDAAAKRFVGTKGVKVVRLNTRLTGDEMILKQGFKDLILEGHVRALVRSKR